MEGLRAHGDVFVLFSHDQDRLILGHYVVKGSDYYAIARRFDSPATVDDHGWERSLALEIYTPTLK